MVLAPVGSAVLRVSSVPTAVTAWQRVRMVSANRIPMIIPTFVDIGGQNAQTWAKCAPKITIALAARAPLESAVGRVRGAQRTRSVNMDARLTVSVSTTTLALETVTVSSAAHVSAAGVVESKPHALPTLSVPIIRDCRLIAIWSVACLATMASATPSAGSPLGPVVLPTIDVVPTSVASNAPARRTTHSRMEMAVSRPPRADPILHASILFARPSLLAHLKSPEEGTTSSRGSRLHVPCRDTSLVQCPVSTAQRPLTR